MSTCRSVVMPATPHASRRPRGRFVRRRRARRRPAPAPMRRLPRIHRTGRTMQFNARAKPQTVEALYAIADRQGWLVGETLEHALAALERELVGKGG